MPEITCRVETPMLGWHHHQVVVVEGTDFVDRLIVAGRLTFLSEVGEEPAGGDISAVTERSPEVDSSEGGEDGPGTPDPAPGALLEPPGASGKP